MYVCSIEKVSFGKGKGFFHATDLQMFLIEKETVYTCRYLFIYLIRRYTLQHLYKM